MPKTPPDSNHHPSPSPVIEEAANHSSTDISYRLLSNKKVLVCCSFLVTCTVRYAFWGTKGFSFWKDQQIYSAVVNSKRPKSASSTKIGNFGNTGSTRTSENINSGSISTTSNIVSQNVATSEAANTSQQSVASRQIDTDKSLRKEIDDIPETTAVKIIESGISVTTVNPSEVGTEQAGNSVAKTRADIEKEIKEGSSSTSDETNSILMLRIQLGTDVIIWESTVPSPITSSPGSPPVDERSSTAEDISTTENSSNTETASKKVTASATADSSSTTGNSSTTAEDTSSTNTQKAPEPSETKISKAAMERDALMGEDVRVITDSLKATPASPEALKTFLNSPPAMRVGNSPPWGVIPTSRWCQLFPPVQDPKENAEIKGDYAMVQISRRTGRDKVEKVCGDDKSGKCVTNHFRTHNKSTRPCFSGDEVLVTHRLQAERNYWASATSGLGNSDLDMTVCKRSKESGVGYGEFKEKELTDCGGEDVATLKEKFINPLKSKKFDFTVCHQFMRLQPGTYGKDVPLTNTGWKKYWAEYYLQRGFDHIFAYTMGESNARAYWREWAEQAGAPKNTNGQGGTLKHLCSEADMDPSAKRTLCNSFTFFVSGQARSWTDSYNYGSGYNGKYWGKPALAGGKMQPQQNYAQFHCLVFNRMLGAKYTLYSDIDEIMIPRPYHFLNSARKNDWSGITNVDKDHISLKDNQVLVYREMNKALNRWPKDAKDSIKSMIMHRKCKETAGAYPSPKNPHSCFAAEVFYKSNEPLVWSRTFSDFYNDEAERKPLTDAFQYERFIEKILPKGDGRILSVDDIKLICTKQEIKKNGNNLRRKSLRRLEEASSKDPDGEEKENIEDSAKVADNEAVPHDDGPLPGPEDLINCFGLAPYMEYTQKQKYRIHGIVTQGISLYKNTDEFSVLIYDVEKKGYRAADEGRIFQHKASCVGPFCSDYNVDVDGDNTCKISHKLESYNPFLAPVMCSTNGDLSVPKYHFFEKENPLKHVTADRPILIIPRKVLGPNGVFVVRAGLIGEEKVPKINQSDENDKMDTFNVPNIPRYLHSLLKDPVQGCSAEGQLSPYKCVEANGNFKTRGGFEMTDQWHYSVGSLPMNVRDNFYFSDKSKKYLPPWNNPWIEEKKTTVTDWYAGLAPRVGLVLNAAFSDIEEFAKRIVSNLTEEEKSKPEFQFDKILEKLNDIKKVVSKPENFETHFLPMLQEIVSNSGGPECNAGKRNVFNNRCLGSRGRRKTIVNVRNCCDLNTHGEGSADDKDQCSGRYPVNLPFYQMGILHMRGMEQVGDFVGSTIMKNRHYEKFAIDYFLGRKSSV